MGQRARTIDHFMSREIRAARIDISALVHDTLESIEPDAHGTTVELDLAEDTSLVTDAEILETVVSNAIDNAARYAESEVRIRGRHTDDGYVLEIADDGPGIPADELAPLDAETETEFTHGRGLGLWQLKWGVTKLNGSLSFDTNHGTTVRITVPDMGDRAGQG
jgi:signal transduction histidine kinase